MRFDPLSAAFFEDPTEMFRWLLEEQPLFHNDDPDFWAVSRYEDVLAGYRNWQQLSSRSGVGVQAYDPAVLGTEAIDGNILSLDPPDHDRLRALLSRSFTPRSARRYEPLIRATIVGFLDELDDRETFDIVTDFSALFPVEVISALLGVPKRDRQQIRKWTADRLYREPGEQQPGEVAAQAFTNLWSYFTDLVAERRSSLGDDMISDLCRAQETLDDGVRTELRDSEIVGFVRLLGSAGSETVTKLVGNAAVLFDRFPDQWAKVVERPDLVPGAVEETIRYWPPVSYSGREAVADVAFSTGVVPAGSRVLLVTGAATHDPRRFERPDSFDIEREQHVQIGFGFGIHTCIGAHLARIESRVAFEEMARRWPDMRVDRDGLRRVHMTNVSGYEQVPVQVTPAAAGSRT